MQRAIETYHITAENIYNWDEKGFLIGIANSTKRIVSLGALQKGQITHASQDGSREFISLLACICADQTYLPPALIYKGESYDLQDSWLEDFAEGEEAFFATSENGWTTDDLGLQWLSRVFEPCTKAKGSRGRRLLLVDGHSSHVNMKFLEYADAHRIIVQILPPHTTHRLQPLDVSLFAPLSTKYTQELNNLMHKSLGLVSMSKRSFWPMFQRAWIASFTSTNIQSAFQKTGVFPFDPSLILNALRPSDEVTEPIVPTIAPKTPMSCRAVRKAHQQFKADPSVANLDLILRANEKLATQHSIDKHINEGLVYALKEEKKRRTRGIRLNLIGEEDNGPQLFTPNRIHAAKIYQKQKAEAVEQEKVDKAKKKAQQAVARQDRDREKQERVLQRQVTKQLAAEKRAATQAKKTASQTVKNQPKLKPKGQSITQQAQSVSTALDRPPVAQDVSEVEKVTSRGRVITKPQRFI